MCVLVYYGKVVDTLNEFSMSAIFSVPMYIGRPLELVVRELELHSLSSPVSVCSVELFVVWARQRRHRRRLISDSSIPSQTTDDVRVCVGEININW